MFQSSPDMIYLNFILRNCIESDVLIIEREKIELENNDFTFVYISQRFITFPKLTQVR